MTVAIAFLAGLVSCASPCVLPVIPVYASYVAGGVAVGGEDTSRGAAAWRAGGFLLGFLGVFVLLWASVGVIGFALLSTIPALRQITGVLIVAMGAAMLLGRAPMLMLPGRVGSLGRGGPLLLGAGVAVGWTPCIGPTLGAILALGASAASAPAGLLLLLAYAAGLAVPFLLVLGALARFRRVQTALVRARRPLELVAGVLTVGVGVLVFSGAFGRLAGLFSFGVI